MSTPKQTQVRARRMWLEDGDAVKGHPNLVASHPVFVLPATSEAYEAMVEQAWMAQGMLTHDEMKKVLSALPADGSKQYSTEANKVAQLEGGGATALPKPVIDAQTLNAYRGDPPSSPDKSAGGTVERHVFEGALEEWEKCERELAAVRVNLESAKEANIPLRLRWEVSEQTSTDLRAKLAQAQQSLADAMERAIRAEYFNERTELQLKNPQVLHTMALRHCTPEQLAHLGGENRTAELNELATLRTQLKDLTDQLSARSQECAEARAEVARLEPDYNVYAKIQDDNISLRAQLAQLKQERDEARTQAGAQAMFGAVGGRLMTRIFEVADMSLPDASDVELQLVRLLDELKNHRARLASPASSPGQEDDDQLIEERDAAEEAADKMASLILGEPIDWPDHDAKWAEAIESFAALPKPTQGAEKGELAKELKRAVSEIAMIINQRHNIGRWSETKHPDKVVAEDILAAITPFFAPLAEPAQAGRTDTERLAVLEWLGERFFFPVWDDNGFWHSKIYETRAIGTTLRQFCDEAIAIRAAMSPSTEDKK